LEEVPAFLAEATAGIFFITPYKRYNSSPIKFGEYLGCGLPVVINAGIGDTEFITREEKVGVVVNDFSKPCYESAIKELMVLLKENDNLKSRCRAAAEKYLSLDIGVEKYLQIYQRLKDESFILGSLSHRGSK
jgi:glycosyltransferase involved in cell wall biosynthesis